MQTSCPDCGEPLRGISSFCFNCGIPLDASGAASDRGRGAATGPEKHPGKTDSREMPFGRDSRSRSSDGRKGIRRMDAVESLVQGFAWMLASPGIFAAFVVVALVTVMAETVSPIFHLVYLPAYAIVVGFAVSKVPGFLGDDSPVARSRQPLAWKALDLVLIGIFHTLVLIVGLLLFVIPGIYLGARFSLAYTACVIDDNGPFESLSKSWAVSADNVPKLVGLVCFALAVGLVTLVLPGGNLTGPIIAFILLFVIPVYALASGALELAFGRIYVENRHQSESISQPSKPRERPNWN